MPHPVPLRPVLAQAPLDPVRPHPHSAMDRHVPWDVRRELTAAVLAHWHDYGCLRVLHLRHRLRQRFGVSYHAFRSWARRTAFAYGIADKDVEKTVRTMGRQARFLRADTALRRAQLKALSRLSPPQNSRKRPSFSRPDAVPAAAAARQSALPSPPPGMDDS